MVFGLKSHILNEYDLLCYVLLCHVILGVFDKFGLGAVHSLPFRIPLKRLTTYSVVSRSRGNRAPL